MPTPAERNALLFTAAVACLGGGVRVLRARSVPPPTAVERQALDVQLAAVDSTRRAKAAIRKPGQGMQDSSAKKAKPIPIAGLTTRYTELRVRQPPSSRHRLDLDLASAVEIQDLPGIGPGIAARIVANRDSNGPFGSLAGLQRVRGIGSVIAGRLDSLVTFSGTPNGVTRTSVATSDSSAAARKRKPARPP